MQWSSLSSQASICSASQEIPCLLQNTKIHYCDFKNLLQVILSQMNPVRMLLIDDLPIYI